MGYIKYKLKQKIRKTSETFDSEIIGILSTRNGGRLKLVLPSFSASVARGGLLLWVV